MNQLSNNNYFVVLLLITLLVLGGAGLGAKMLVTTILEDTAVFDAKNKANDQLTKNLETAPRLVAAYEELGARQTLIADALPNTADLPGLMALLENMSGAAGVTLKSISPDQTGGGSAATTPSATAPATTGSQPASSQLAPKPYAFAVAFDGSYPALLKLLEGMEQSARPMRVTSLQLSGTGSNLAIQLGAMTYYQDKATLPIKMEMLKK